MDESIMEGIQGIKGYMGGAINNYTGECLICDSNKLQGSLEEVSATFNDIFRDSHKVSNDLKLGSTHIMEIHTEKSTILMGCSGENADIHLHLFAIFAKDGNAALGKMQIDKILPKAVAALS